MANDTHGNRYGYPRYERRFDTVPSHGGLRAANFPLDSNRPMTEEEYLAALIPWETQAEAPPQGLQAAPPVPSSYAAPSPEQYYRGRGPEGEMAFTNIPEIAEQRGLRKFDLAPPIASVGGVEMYGSEAPTGSITPWEIKTPLEYAQMMGAFKGAVTPPSQANLMPRTAEEAQAEVQRMITVGRQKGYADNDILADIRERGLDKMLSPKATTIPYEYGGKQYNLTPEQVAGLEKSKGKTQAERPQRYSMADNSTSQRLFGKPAADLSQDEWQKVYDAKISQEGEIAKEKRVPPQKTVDLLGSLQNEVAKLGSLSEEFNPAYGGHTIMGPWSTKIEKLFKDDPGKGQAEWWQDYKEMDAVKRHELFGATLTAVESKAWDAVTVDERTNPERIKEAIKKRMEIMANVFNRMNEFYGKFYNMPDIEDLMVGEIPVRPPRAQEEIAQPGAAATGGGHPEGTTIKNPTTGARMIMRGEQWQPL